MSSQIQADQAAELKFQPISPKQSATIAVLSLNRPDAANAFNASIMDALTAHLYSVAQTPHCRALVLRGRGKHFSAGADLAWMQAAADLSYADNVRDAQALTRLFEALTQLPVPSIAMVHGAVFGGAVGLVASCDIAIAADTARFALSEAKIGLLPAVILPYLARKMLPGQLRRHALSGRIFSASEALAFGLLERCVPEAELLAAVREELNFLLQASSQAQAAVKTLHHQVLAQNLQQGDYTAQAIATARTSASGQAGLKAFFAKTPAPWNLSLSADWSLD